MSDECLCCAAWRKKSAEVERLQAQVTALQEAATKRVEEYRSLNGAYHRLFEDFLVARAAALRKAETGER